MPNSVSSTRTRIEFMTSATATRAERRAAPKPARIPSGDRATYSSNEGSSLRADRVAHATHVLDEVRAELAPQLVDVDRDRVALDLLAPAVEAILELRARE